MHKLNVVNLFPGQGSLYNGVGRTFAKSSNKYSEYMSIIGDISVKVLGEDISASLESYFRGELKLRELSFSATQILLFMVNILVDDYYKKYNVEAHCYAGHSFGEISALTAAGYITFSQGIEIVCHRSYVLLNSHVEGGMGIMFCSAKKTVSIIGITERDDVFIANENSPEQTVITGTREGLKVLEQECKKLDVSYLALEASKYPFHSPLLKAASIEFENRISHIIPMKSNISVYSSINHSNYDFEQQSLSETLANHFILPVKFSQGIKHLKSLGYNTFIEVGGQKALTGLVLKIIGEESNHLFLQSTVNGKDEEQIINDSIKKLSGNMTSIDNAYHSGSLQSVTNEELFKNTMLHFMELSRRVSQNNSNNFDSKPFEDLLFNSVLTESREEAVNTVPESEAVEPSENHLKNINVSEHKEESEDIPSEPESAVSSGEIEVTEGVVEDSPVNIVYREINKDTIEEEILQLVQDLTEYPREVLDLDAEFEADLGIDSVKQWGILSALQEQYDVQHLFEDRDPSEYNTIGKIVEILQ